jgi:hypothetical protein
VIRFTIKPFNQPAVVADVGSEPPHDGVLPVCAYSGKDPTQAYPPPEYAHTDPGTAATRTRSLFAGGLPLRICTSEGCISPKPSTVMPEECVNSL